MNKIHNTGTLSQSQNGRNKIPFSFNSNDSFVTAMTRNAFSKSLWLYKQSSTGSFKKGRAEDFRVGVALTFLRASCAIFFSAIMIASFLSCLPG